MSSDERISFKKDILNRAFALKKENNMNLKIKIENTHGRLLNQTKWWGKNESRNFKLRIILENNLDLHPSIFKLFYIACWIDTFGFILSSFVNAFYLLNFFGFVLGCDIFGAAETQAPWPWEGLLITNLLWFIFVIHFISDYYKLCLRGSYRNQLLKLFFLDFLTLNVLSVIGILIFARNRALMLKVFGDDQIEYESLHNQQTIKRYAWIILKVELISSSINLIIFLLAFLLGYFIESILVKNICLFLMFLPLFFFMVLLFPNFIWAMIAQKILINLTRTKSTHYFLTVIHFLAMFNSYYLAIFLNFLTLSNFDQEYILQNW